MSYFGRTPSRAEYYNWYGKGSRELERALINNDQNVYGKGVGSIGTDIDSTSGKVTTTFHKDPIVTKPVSMPSDSATHSSTSRSPLSDTPTPVASPVPTPLDYNDWLHSPFGQSYNTQVSKKYLNNLYDPIYNKRKEAEEFAGQTADTTLATNVTNETRYQGEDAAERGIFGSGVYQQELGRALTNLKTTHENEWGTGEYTPYSMRLAEIENQRKEAKRDELGRQTGLAQNAWNVYRTEFNSQNK